MRACGACTACCTTMAVVELGKKAGEQCRHLTATGCGIYATRPEECQRYFCLWADPQATDLNLPDWGRPDRTGLILQSTGHDLNAKDASVDVIPIGGRLPPAGSPTDYWGQKLLKQKRLRSFPYHLKQRME